MLAETFISGEIVAGLCYVGKSDVRVKVAGGQDMLNHYNQYSY